jgi:hypothetical protein
MTGRRIIGDYFFEHPEEFPRDDNKAQVEQVSNDIEFREYILNALKTKNLK